MELESLAEVLAEIESDRLVLSLLLLESCADSLAILWLLDALCDAESLAETLLLSLSRVDVLAERLWLPESLTLS